MSEEIKVVEQELSELLQVRRDKLKALQDEGRDPFHVTKFNRTAFSKEVIDNFEEMEEKPVWREGVSYYPMTLNVGNMEEPGDDRLFYFDANLTRPDWQPGERIAVTAHDKAVGAWEKL